MGWADRNGMLLLELECYEKLSYCRGFLNVYGSLLVSMNVQKRIFVLVLEHHWLYIVKL